MLAGLFHKIIPIFFHNMFLCIYMTSQNGCLLQKKCYSYEYFCDGQRGGK
jgi:hypothetical protein